jgi:murein DD-endopeptidase MepM/ murein hydrolase activator NlpD
VSRTFIFLVVAVLLAGGALLAHVFGQRGRRAVEWNRQVALARSEAERIRRTVVVPQDQPVRNGDTFAEALEKLGLSAEEARNATTAARSAFDLRQLRTGNSLTVGRSLDGQLREIDYRIDGERVLKILPGAPGYSAQVAQIASRIEVAAVHGTVEESLFKGIEQAGESAELAMRMAQIFGYDLDFYTDPRRGDTFSILLEKKRYANGQPAGYGRIFAAEYDNAGRSYQALLYHDAAGHPAYYRQDGRSLQKAFLRSPLKFGAPVTSHFSQARFHPVLKIYRAHLGTDYAAPVGTPVQTIGSGRVTFAGSKGGEGNMIEIAHARGYQTMYLHLSKIFVRPGQPVEIGRTIGLVGSTGLATGPHLDFRILERGQYRNFEKLGLPPSDPVAKKDFAEFAALSERWLSLLKNPDLLRTAAASAVVPAP